jgi:hypothetical protein
MREKNIDSGSGQTVHELVADQLHGACDRAVDQFDGPDKLATTLPELSAHLRTLAAAELPSVTQVQAEATAKLAVVAQKAYADELRRTSLVDDVFPRKTLTVKPEALDEEYSGTTPTVSRFRRITGKSNVAAEGTYRRVRDEAIGGAQADIEINATNPPEFDVAPEPVADAYVAAVSGLATDIESVRQVADLYLTPIKRTFVEWVTRKAVEYESTASTGVANVNRAAKVLGGKVEAVLSDPVGYFSDAVVAALQEEYVSQGRQAAELTARSIVGDSLAVLNDELRQYVADAADDADTADAASSMEPAMKVSDEPVEPEKPPAEITDLTEYRKKQAEQELRGKSKYYPLWKAELRAHWLDEDDREREVYRFEDGKGNRVLVVSAMSSASAEIAKTYTNIATDKDDFDKHWQTVFGKAAPIKGVVIKGFKGPGNKPSEVAAAYRGIQILGDGPNHPNARRVYFARLQASRLFDDETLQARGVDPEDWVIVQLGLCRKKKQVKLLQGFTGLSADVLRNHGVGSI